MTLNKHVNFILKITRKIYKNHPVSGQTSHRKINWLSGAIFDRLCFPGILIRKLFHKKIKSSPIFVDHLPDIELTREVLYQRHRLSHQQIDDFLGEQHHDLVLEEKLEQFGLVALFLEITTALCNAGIWFVAYKGPLLSYRIYKDSTCRRFKDYDLLVKPDDVPKTIATLCNLGFHPRSLKWPSSRNKEKRILLLLNQFTLDHSSKFFSVEIHWSLVKYPAVTQKRMAAIVEDNLQQTIFAGKIFNQFTPELELLHLVIHGGLHTWSRLKWLIDIHEIIYRFTIDETKFTMLIKLLHAERLVGLCNALLGHYFPGTARLPADYYVPKWCINYVLHQISRTSAIPVFLPEDLNRYRWFHIHAFPHNSYRLRKVFVLFIFFLQNEKIKLLQSKLTKRLAQIRDNTWSAVIYIRNSLVLCEEIIHPDDRRPK
jgi:hypothetical protein